MVSFFWLGYFFLHSFLAADFVKKRFPDRAYRLFYNFVATTLLLGIGYFLSVNRSAALFEQSGVSKFIALALTAYGVIVVRMSFRQYSVKAFLGLSKEIENESFKASGILSRVRHPLYSGTILICLGFVLYIPNVLNAVSVAWIFAYLPVGIWLEEKKLVKKYGRDYEDYKSKVPAVVPRLF